MNRRFAPVFGFLVLATTTVAQNYKLANDWMDFNTSYQKILLEKDGIVRVLGSQTIFGTGSFPVANLHLHYRGQEQRIYVEDVNGNGVFDGNDFIEFLGRRNDGAEDAVLYRNTSGAVDPSLQPIPGYSLFTDQSAYFLSANNTPRSGEFTYENVVLSSGMLAGLPVAQHCRYTAYQEFTNTSSNGYFNGGPSIGLFETTMNPEYTTGEGYINSGALVSPSQPRIVNMSSPYKAAAPSQAPELRVRLAGISTDFHTVNITAAGSTQQVQYNGISIQTVVLNPSHSALGNTITEVRVEPQGTVDNNRVPYIELAYDRQFRFDTPGEVEFDYENPGSGNQRVTLQGLGIQPGGGAILYDLANGRRFVGVVNGTDVDFRLDKPAASGPTRFFASTFLRINENSAVLGFESAVLNNYSAASAGSEFVIISHPSLQLAAEEYANYRDTAKGGLDAKVYYVDAIYDEFGYGSVTPLAIKRFMINALNTWTTQPRYVFFLGKARSKLRSFSDWLVPTWGEPASDYLFVSNLHTDRRDVELATAVGRYNAVSEADALTFLSKVDEYEHTPWQFWMKQGVHLGGGQDADEQNNIRFYMESQHEPIYEGVRLGGFTYYAQKQTNSVVTTNPSANTRDVINEGAQLIQFFGHSTASLTDVDFQEPTFYTNNNRYPFIIGNGCYTGDFGQNGNTFSERWLREPGKGAIGYYAMSSTGYLSYLGQLTSVWYRNAYQDTLGLPVGDIIKRTVYDYCVDTSNGFRPGVQQRVHCQCSNLQGDPALSLYFPGGPDLEINSGSLSFEPDPLVADLDSFDIFLVVRNLGQVFQDSFDVRIQMFNVATGINYDFGPRRFPAIAALDTLSFRVGITGNDFPGLNLFDVFVDSQDTIPEIDESNNRLEFQISVPAKVAVPLHPYEFAIVNQAEALQLVAGTYAVGFGDATYEFEFDTTHTFNSPFKVNSGPVNGTLQEARWTVPVTLQDSQVYYWRVRLTAGGEPFWGESSMKYIAGPRMGWAQSRPPQFFENPTEAIAMNPKGFQWEYAASSNNFLATMYRGGREYKHSFGDGKNTQAEINFFNGSENTPLNYLVYCQIDGKTLQPVTFDPLIGWAGLLAASNGLNELENLIANLPNGDWFYLAKRSDGFPPVATWPASTFTALEQVGVNTTQLRNAPSNEQFMLIGRKGAAPGTAQLLVEPNQIVYLDSEDSSQIRRDYVLDVDLYGNLNQGSIETVRIGPANAWDDLTWGWESLDGPSTADSIAVDVYGIRPNGTSDTLLVQNAILAQALSGIDAAQFPYLRLQAVANDINEHTPPQLDNWHVYFAPAADLAVDPEHLYEFNGQLASEGQNIRLALGYRNLTSTPFDSLLVRLQARLPDGSLQTLANRRRAPLYSFATDTVVFNFSTAGLVGATQLLVEVNPEYDQPEQYLFNNLFVQNFGVEEDRINPILDVRFDGRRIADGAIVSPNPTIELIVRDENTYPAFQLNDSTLVEIWWDYLEDGEFSRQIPPNDSTLSFKAAQVEAGKTVGMVGSENQATWTFRPGPLAPGAYELQAQSYDKSGNASGLQRYKVTFRVEADATLTDVLPYPNPFATETRFVYTLTGLVEPEEFYIQIYAPSGQHVKTIDLKALGEVRIGENITNYAWDGTDARGNRLARGLYLYRTVVKMPEGYALQYDTDATQAYFNKGWGKMYILR